MKIAFITPGSYPTSNSPSLPFGGSELSVFYVAREIALLGHDVYIFSLDSPDTIKIEKHDNIWIKRYPAKRNFIMKIHIFIDLNKSINRHKFDIIHFYGMGVLPISYLIKMIHHTKTVFTLNYYYNICYKNTVEKKNVICTKCNIIDLLFCSKNIIETFEITIYRFLSFIHDRYIVLSIISMPLFKTCGFPEKKMVVIPNIFSESIKYNRRQNNGNIILYTGRLIEYKGVDLLLLALSKIKNRIKNISCYIVGTGPEMAKLKKLAHEIGVEDYVYFTGFVEHDKMISYYLQSDLFIFPIRWVEPFGRSLLEAMNYGLPSIVSDNIDPEIRDDAMLVFKSNDWNDLADKIIYLLSDPHERERLSRNAKIHVKNYAPDKIIPKIEKIYIDLL